MHSHCALYRFNSYFVRLVFVLCLVFSLCPAAFAASADTDSTSSAPAATTVKVGYMDLPGFLYKDDAGFYEGYAYDLLQQIGALNNWNYEFVQTGYSEIESRLASGEIDVFLPHQKTKERAAIYEFSDEVFCTNEAALLTLPSSGYYYEDFDHFDGMRVGVAKNTRNKGRFEDLFKSKGVKNASFVQDYNSVDEMKKALQENKIDAFICASSRGISDCCSICKLDATSSYVLGRKGERKFVDKIDEAIRSIEVSNPLYAAQLEDKYRIPEDGNYPALTRAEADYVKKVGSATVLVGKQDVDTSTGQFSGSIGQVLGEITDKVGLEFEPVACNGTTELMDKFDAGEADMLFSFDDNNQWALEHNAVLTQPYAEFNALYVAAPNATDSDKVAVVKDSYIEFYAQNYFDYDLVQADSVQAALDMVNAGDAGACIIAATYGSYYATFPKYSRLVFNTMFDFSIAYSMGVSRNADPMLVSILNKSIASMSHSKLNSYFDSQIGSKKTSVADVFYSNLPLAIAIIVFMSVLVVALAGGSIHLRSMRRKNRELEEANNAKSNFLSRMSHEMRTPINAISGFAALTEQNLEQDKIDKALLREYAVDTASSSQYLLSLVNDLLDMSKIDNDKIELSPSVNNTEEFINGLRIMIETQAAAKGVHLHFRARNKLFPYFIGDTVRIQQILMNLLNNAVKFTPEGGDVSFEVEALERKDGKTGVKVCISDSGVGMTEEFQKVMFTPFTQEFNGSTSPYGGTGLGLAVSRRLARLMDGDITCESAPGKGSTFTVLLKVGTVEEGEYSEVIEPAKSGDYDFTGHRVLICEDNPLNQKIAAQLLENKGCTVDVAENGNLGLHSFEEFPAGTYGLILMDIRMPVMDGLEATRAIRASEHPDAQSIPIVAMSANAYPEDVRSSLDAGMNAHLAKPIDVDALYATVEKYLNS